MILQTLRRLLALFTVPVALFVSLINPHLVFLLIVIGAALMIVGIYLTLRDRAAQLILTFMSAAAKMALIVVGVGLILGGLLGLALLYGL